MSYQIKIRGENEGIEVDNDKGLKILGAWNSYLENKRDNNIAIQIGSFHGTVSDIKSIRKEADAKTVAPEFEQYIREHTRVANMTPKEKASRGGFLKLMHFALTSKRLEDEAQEFKVKMVELALEFFKVNPNRIYPDPIVFKELYNGAERANKIAFSIMEHTIQRDSQQATYCV